MRSTQLLRLAAVFALSLNASAETIDTAPAPSPAAASIEPLRLEIRDYRFSPHRAEKYERLVIEFVQKDPTLKTEPTVRVTPGVGSGEANVFVDHATLAGAISESLINDLFASKSQYVSNMTMNMESTDGGFSIRVSLKDPSVSLNPFWLSNPPRLVIDAIGAKNSPGRDVASVKKTSSKAKRRASKKQSKSNSLTDYYCFMANSQKPLSVVFQKTSDNSKKAQVTLGGQYGGAAQSQHPADAIYCYPQAARVNASLSIARHTSAQQSSAQPNTPSTLLDEQFVGTPQPVVPLQAPIDLTQPASPVPADDEDTGGMK